MRKLFIPILILVAFILIINNDIIYSQGTGTLGSNKSWAVSDTLFADFFMADDSAIVYFISPMHFDSLSVSYITKDTTDTTVVLSVWEVGRIRATGDYWNFPENNLLFEGDAFIFRATDSSRVQVFIGEDILAGYNPPESSDNWTVLKIWEYLDDSVNVGAIAKGVDITYLAVLDDSVRGDMIGLQIYSGTSGTDAYADEVWGAKITGYENVGHVHTAIGLEAIATGADSNIGIKGTGSNYAGYFVGNIFVSDTAIIDTINPRGDYVVVLDTIIAVEAILIGDDHVDLLDSVMYMISDTATAGGGTDSSWHLLTADTVVITANIQIGDDKVDIIDSVRYIISDSIQLFDEITEIDGALDSLADKLSNDAFSDSIDNHRSSFRDSANSVFNDSSSTIFSWISDSIQLAETDTVRTKYIQGILSTGLGDGLKVEANTITFTSIDSPNIHIAIGEDATINDSVIVQIKEVIDRRFDIIKGINVEINNDGDNISTDLYGIYSKALNAGGNTARATGIKAYVNKTSGTLPIGIGIDAISTNADSNIGIKAQGDNYAGYFIGDIFVDDDILIGDEKIDLFDSIRYIVSDTADAVITITNGLISDSVDALRDILGDTVLAYGYAFYDSATVVFNDSSGTIQGWLSDTIQIVYTKAEVLSEISDTIQTVYTKSEVLDAISDSIQDAKRDTIHLMDLDTPGDSPVLYFEETDSALVYNSGRGAIDIGGGYEDVYMYFHSDAIFDTLGLLAHGKPYFRNKVTITPVRWLDADTSYNCVKVEAPDSANAQYYCAVLEWDIPEDFYSWTEDSALTVLNHRTAGSALQLIVYKNLSSDSVDYASNPFGTPYWTFDDVYAAGPLNNLNEYTWSVRDKVIFQFMIDVDANNIAYLANMRIRYNKK